MMNREAVYFSSPAEFRKWLEKNAETETELLVGFYKTKTGKPSMSWPESVDQALCFGWIDGVRKSVDGDRYTIRFTPRKPTSIWSAVNIGKMETLEKAGLMTDLGRKAFAHRKESKSRIYSHEKEASVLDSDLESEFRKNAPAWDFFIEQAPSYKKVIVHWIMSAKQEKTRASRLEKVIEASGRKKRLR